MRRIRNAVLTCGAVTLVAGCGVRGAGRVVRDEWRVMR